jgi:uncharacterized protein (DUF4213/DUF364 family)
MIETSIIEVLSPKLKGLKIQDVRIGLGYTAIQNSAGGLGLAYTFRNYLPNRCSIVKEAGNLIGKDVIEIANLFLDKENLINASLGLAAINSIAKPENDGVFEGDILEAININPDDKVLMVGHFAPIAFEIKKITPHFFVIDDGLNVNLDNSTSQLDEVMNYCNIAIITATSLINKTLGDIISKTKNARKRILLGPSTPLFKEVFRNKGIDILSGMIPENAPKILEIVSQGGGTMHFKNFSRKMNYFVN